MLRSNLRAWSRAITALAVLGALAACSSHGPNISESQEAARYAARARGIPTVELNLEPSDNAGSFDAARYGPATETVPAFVAELLA